MDKDLNSMLGKISFSIAQKSEDTEKNKEEAKDDDKKKSLNDKVADHLENKNDDTGEGEEDSNKDDLDGEERNPDMNDEKKETEKEDSSDDGNDTPVDSPVGLTGASIGSVIDNPILTGLNDDETVTFDNSERPEDEHRYKVVETPAGILTILSVDYEADRVTLLDCNNQEIAITIADFNDLEPVEIKDDDLADVQKLRSTPEDDELEDDAEDEESEDNSDESESESEDEDNEGGWGMSSRDRDDGGWDLGGGGSDEEPMEDFGTDEEEAIKAPYISAGRDKSEDNKSKGGRTSFGKTKDEGHNARTSSETYGDNLIDLEKASDKISDNLTDDEEKGQEIKIRKYTGDRSIGEDDALLFNDEDEIDRLIDDTENSEFSYEDVCSEAGGGSPVVTQEDVENLEGTKSNKAAQLLEIVQATNGMRPSEDCPNEECVGKNSDKEKTRNISKKINLHKIKKDLFSSKTEKEKSEKTIREKLKKTGKIRALKNAEKRERITENKAETLRGAIKKKHDADSKHNLAKKSVKSIKSGMLKEKSKQEKRGSVMSNKRTEITGRVSAANKTISQRSKHTNGFLASASRSENKIIKGNNLSNHSIYNSPLCKCESSSRRDKRLEALNDRVSRRSTVNKARYRKETTQACAIAPKISDMYADDYNFDMNKILTQVDGEYIYIKAEGNRRVGHIFAKPKNEVFLKRLELISLPHQKKTFNQLLEMVKRTCVNVGVEVKMRKMKRLERSSRRMAHKRFEDDEENNSIPFEIVMDGQKYSGTLYAVDDTDNAEDELEDMIEDAADIEDVDDEEWESGEDATDDNEDWDDDAEDSDDDDEDDDEEDSDDDDEDEAEETDEDDQIVLSDDDIDEMEVEDFDDEDVEVDAKVANENYHVTFVNTSKKIRRAAKRAFECRQYSKAWNLMAMNARKMIVR